MNKLRQKAHFHLLEKVFHLNQIVQLKVETIFLAMIFLQCKEGNINRVYRQFEANNNQSDCKERIIWIY